MQNTKTYESKISIMCTETVRMTRFGCAKVCHYADGNDSAGLWFIFKLSSLFPLPPSLLLVLFTRLQRHESWCMWTPHCFIYIVLTSLCQTIKSYPNNPRVAKAQIAVDILSRAILYMYAYTTGIWNYEHCRRPTAVLNLTFKQLTWPAPRAQNTWPSFRWERCRSWRGEAE